jgi:hypothetical protein
MRNDFLLQEFLEGIPKDVMLLSEYFALHGCLLRFLGSLPTPLALPGFPRSRE